MKKFRFSPKLTFIYPDISKLFNVQCSLYLLISDLYFLGLENTQKILILSKKMNKAQIIFFEKITDLHSYLGLAIIKALLFHC